MRAPDACSIAAVSMPPNMMHFPMRAFISLSQRGLGTSGGSWVGSGSGFARVEERRWHFGGVVEGMGGLEEMRRGIGSRGFIFGVVEGWVGAVRLEEASPPKLFVSSVRR